MTGLGAGPAAASSAACRCRGLTHGGLQAWPSEGGFRGPFARAKPPMRATALLFHVHARHAGQQALSAEAHGSLGLRVVLTRYPACRLCAGKSGESESESAMEADAAPGIELAY